MVCYNFDMIQIENFHVIIIMHHMIIIFGIIVFEMLVGRNTPSIGETFGSIFRSLRQMGYMSRPCPKMARKCGKKGIFAQFWANKKIFFLS